MAIQKTINLSDNKILSPKHRYLSCSWQELLCLPSSSDFSRLVERVRLMIGRSIGNYPSREFHHYCLSATWKFSHIIPFFSRRATPTCESPRPAAAQTWDRAGTGRSSTSPGPPSASTAPLPPDHGSDGWEGRGHDSGNALDSISEVFLQENSCQSKI